MTKKRLYVDDILHRRLKAVSDEYGVPMETLTELALNGWLSRVESDGLYGKH